MTPLTKILNEIQEHAGQIASLNAAGMAGREQIEPCLVRDIPRLIAALRKAVEQRDVLAKFWYVGDAKQAWIDQYDKDIAAILTGEGGKRGGG